MNERVTTLDARSPDSGEQQLLTCTVGSMLVAVPTAAVQRILRMAALSPAPNPMPGVVGLLNIAGEVVPVVDPRPVLGVHPAQVAPGQFLVLMAATSRYLLWVDAIGRIVDAPLLPAPASVGQTTDFMAQIEGRVVPILDVDALDPARAGDRTAPR
jgi:chemotaxis signal transduction protein